MIKKKKKRNLNKTILNETISLRSESIFANIFFFFFCIDTDDEKRETKK